MAQNRISFPLFSLNYTENIKVSHFGKIQYWIQNDSHTQVCLQAFCTSWHPTVILKLHKGEEKARQGLYFSLSSNCFETNSLTSYQQCGSICFIQKQLGEEMFTSIKTSEVRQTFPIVTATRLRKPHVCALGHGHTCLPARILAKDAPRHRTAWEKGCTSIGKTLGRGVEDWKTLRKEGQDFQFQDMRMDTAYFSFLILSHLSRK